MIAAGGGAFDSLRLEKGYRLWGQDIHTEYNPYEAGLGFAVRLDKGDFIGPATRWSGIKERRAARKLCCLTLDDPAVVVMGKEPILRRRRVLGLCDQRRTTATRSGASIAYGYLPIELAAEGTPVQVEFFDEPIAAHVSAEPALGPQRQAVEGMKEQRSATRRRSISRPWPMTISVEQVRPTTCLADQAGEIAEGTQILLDRGWGAERVLNRRNRTAV